MKKVILAAFAVVVLVGGFAFVSHHAQNVASDVTPQLDPGTGGGRM
jgi:hypothetical protein